MMRKRTVFAVCTVGLTLVFPGALGAQERPEELIEKALAAARRAEEAASRSASEVAEMRKLYQQERTARQRVEREVMELKKFQMVGDAVGQAEAKISSPASSSFFHDPALHKRPIKLGGYVETAYQYSLNRPDDRINAYRVYDREDVNDFDVHLAEISFDGTAQDPGQAGFRLDLAFGTSVDKFASFDRTVPAADNLMDLKQAYLDYIAPVGKGIRFSFGKFVTPFGFEGIESQENWNATHGLLFGFTVPATHTGLRAEYAVLENWSVGAFLVNGHDQLQDRNRDKTGMLTSTWSPWKWLTWKVNAAAGSEQGGNRDTDENGKTLYLANSVLTLSPWEGWTFALDVVYGYEEDAGLKRLVSSKATNDDGQYFAAGAFFKWQFLKNWHLAGRGEFMNDLGGARLGVPMKLYSATATVGWRVAEPLEIRFEYRHDGSNRNPFSDSESPAFTGHAAYANSRGGRATQDTLMVQWLYKF